MSLVANNMATTNGINGINGINSERSSNDQRAQPAQGHGSPSTGDDMSREYKPPPSSFSSPTQNGSFDKKNDAFADFFSSEVFQIVLHNPATAHRMLKFSQARMCGENMEFLEKVVDDLAPQTIRLTNFSLDP